MKITKWPFSYWVFLSLLIGLLSCLGAMCYVLYLPVDVDDLGISVMPEPEAPFYSSSHDSEVENALDILWASTVWIGREVSPGVTQYVGTGWVIGHNNVNGKKLSYIATAAHVASHRMDLPLKVGYLGYSGIWSEVPGVEIKRFDGRKSGDIAIMSIEKDLQSVKFANNQSTFAVSDEVFIAGVQSTAPPAIVSIGIIKAIDRKGHEFQVKGWGWHGFSGGPVMLRKTGDVIGFVAWGVKKHLNDASRSDCGDLTHFMELLKACKLEKIVLE